MHIPPFALVLTAAGSSLRFSSSFAEGESVKKEFLKIDGHSVLYRAALPFYRTPGLAAVAVTYREGCEDETIIALEDLADISAIPLVFVRGGETRQESVYLALEKLAALPVSFDYAAIHDGARPYITQELILSTLAVAATEDAALPGLAVTDSIRRIDRNGHIVEIVDRRGLVRVQTPQIFPFTRILEAHRLAGADNSASDDAELYIKAGGQCTIVPGDEKNIKITFEQDIPDAREQILTYIEERREGRKEREHSQMFRRFLNGMEDRQ